MTDTFFDRLELELRAAAERPPRRAAGMGRAAAVALVAAAGIAIAIVPALALLGGESDDGALRKGPGHGRVVGRGEAPVAGPWRLEASRHLGRPCLFVWLPDPPGRTSAGGYCGRFPKTPGFGRAQVNVPNRHVREVLVYGPAPKRAAMVMITAEGRVAIKSKPHDGYYLIPVRPGMRHGRINWLDAEGRPGSPGIELMPPASGHVNRG